MNDTIIVGVTDAAVSQRAIDWAVRRAADRGGRVELLSLSGDISTSSLVERIRDA